MEARPERSARLEDILGYIRFGLMTMEDIKLVRSNKTALRSQTLDSRLVEALCSDHRGDTDPRILGYPDIVIECNASPVVTRSCIVNGLVMDIEVRRCTVDNRHGLNVHVTSRASPSSLQGIFALPYARSLHGTDVVCGHVMSLGLQNGRSFTPFTPGVDTRQDAVKAIFDVAPGEIVYVALQLFTAPFRGGVTCGIPITNDLPYLWDATDNATVGPLGLPGPSLGAGLYP